MDYICENLSEDLNCAIVAKKYHYSEYHFHRLFKYITNISITDYIRNRRLYAASKELTKNNDTIFNISLLYGFNNLRTFDRAFKNRYGMTPTDFKHQSMPLYEESPDEIISNFHSRSVKENWEAVRKIIPVALQVYTVRHDAERDFKGTMTKIRDMGYKSVELSMPPRVDMSTIRGTLEDLDFNAFSVHVPLEALASETKKIVETYRAIGCKYIVIGSLQGRHSPGSPFFGEALEMIRRIGSICNDKGITLLYHNYDFDFHVMPGGGYGLDHIFSCTSPDLLQAELDTYWLTAAGQDPVSYIEKYAMRVPVIHLKDYENAEFRPLGHGMLEIPSILTAAVASGVEWIVVEQDNSFGHPPMEAMKISREYLQGLGL